jgi:TolA-binding protein
MLDYASILLILIIGSLAVMITMFLKRRSFRSRSSKESNDHEHPSDLQQIVGKPRSAESGPASSRSTEEVEKAREELRTLNLRREIVASALTAIFEAEAQGKIGCDSRDSLIETHKAQMRALDDQIAERKKVTELSDLLNEREELVRSFEQRIAEIDGQLQRLNGSPELRPQIPPIGEMAQEAARMTDVPKTSADANSAEEKRPVERAKGRTEERIDQIREEVLKAIERLEKIESEG